MLLNHGASAEGVQVLSPQTVEAMIGRQRVFSHDKTFNAMIDWGLGVILNSNIYGNENAPYQFGPRAGRRTFGHSGNQSSIGFADPDNSLVAVVIFNAMPGEAAHQARMRGVIDAIHDDLHIQAAS